MIHKRLYTLTILFLLIQSSANGQPGKPEGSFDLVIKNVNLIDGTGSSMQSKVNVFIKDGLVAKIEQGILKTKYDNELDASEMYLIPGLIDGHTHPSPTGFVPYGPENFPETFSQFIHFGVTSILVPGCSRCTYDNMALMKSLGEKNDRPAPRVFHTSPHFTMEGSHPVKTFKNPEWVDGKTIHYLRDSAQISDLVRIASENSAIGIKVTIEDGPTKPWVPRMPQKFVDKIAESAKMNSLEVFAHVSDIDEVRIANKSGVQNLLHLAGVNIDWKKDKLLMDSLKARDVNWVTTLMIYKSFLYPYHPEWLNREDIIHVFNEDEVATLRNNEGMKARSSAFVSDETVLLSDFLKSHLEDVFELNRRGFNMVVGTDQGNPFVFPGISMHEEMQILSLAGIPNAEIIKMATHNGAVMLNISDMLGTIKPGKYADMILLDANPLEDIRNTLRIRAVYKNGVLQSRIKK